MDRAVPPAEDERQRLRLQRVALAVSGSLLMGAMALGMAWAGYIPLHAAAIYAALTAALCAVFYGAIRSGLNLRFADPNLSVAQLGAAALAISYMLYESAEARPAFLAVYLLAYSFGASALRTRTLVLMALFYVACHASVIGLLFLLRPAVTDLRRELFQLFVYSVLMGWASYVASHIGRLRRESRRSTEELKIEIAERRKAAAAWQQAESKYAAIFNSNPQAIVLTRLSDGVILAVNDAWVRDRGAARDEVLGRSAFELRSWVDPKARAAVMARLDAQGIVTNFETRLRRPDDSEIDVLISGARVQIDGNACVMWTWHNVTEQRSAEQVGRLADARYRALFESALDGMVISRPDGVIIDVNPVVCRLTGFGREELVGHNVMEFSDAAELAGNPLRTDAATRWDRRERVLKARDGSSLPTEIVAGPMPDGNVLAILRDITDRRRAKEELHANRRLLEIVIDAIPMAIFAKDTDSNYVMVNKYMADFFESSKQAMIRLHTSRLPTHDATRRQAIADDQWVYQQRQTFTHETTIQRPDGTPVPFHSSKIPLFDDAGALVGLLGVNRDTSDELRVRKRVERLNAELEERVEARTGELRAALKELDAFAYSVSHDLRAPVGAVSGFAHLLRTNEASKLSDDGRYLLGMIEHNAERMVQLIEGLLRLSRLGRSQINRAPLSMASLVRDALHLHQNAPGADIRIGTLPDCSGDAVLIGQVWANLLGNALKYSRTRRPARVEAGWDGDKKAYFVRDNGIGFDMQYAPKLFGVFERLHSNPEFEGSGIGLAIVRRIIELHGGRIWADAAVDRGATFWFTVPVPASAPPA